MGKINIDKPDSLSSIRTDAQRDLNKATKIDALASEKKIPANEDRLDISSRGAEVGNLVEKLKTLPDVRAERINSLREQVNVGGYKPTGGDIADAILKSERS